MYSILAKLADYLEKNGAEKEAEEIKQTLTKLSATPLPDERIEEGIRESMDEEFKKELKEEGWKNPKITYPEKRRPLEYDTKMLEKSIRDSISRSLRGLGPESEQDWMEDPEFMQKLQQLLKEKGYDIVKKTPSGPSFGTESRPPLPRKAEKIAAVEEIKKLPGTEKFPYDYEDTLDEEEIKKSIVGIEKILEDPAVAPDFKGDLAKTLSYLRDKLKEVRNMPKEYKGLREELREDLQAGERTDWADDEKQPTLKQLREKSMLPPRDPEAVKIEREEIEEIKNRQKQEELAKKEKDAPAKKDREEAEAEFNEFLTKELGMTLKEFKTKFENVLKSNWRGPVGKIWNRDPETGKMIEQKKSQLLELADKLDKAGAVEEANMIDEFLKIAAGVSEFVLVFSELSSIADKLDKSGAVEEANMIDEFLKTAADVKWKEESDTEQAKRYDSEHHHSLQVREPKREQEKVDREGRKEHHVHTYQETGASALSTRYCPEHVGVMLGRVGPNSYQCPLDGQIYNWETGWTDYNGVKHPGGSVAAQTPDSTGYGIPHRIFDSRENILNRIN